MKSLVASMFLVVALTVVPVALLAADAPETTHDGRQRVASENAGLLCIELFDGATGEILARAADRRRAREAGFMNRQTMVTNRAEAEDCAWQLA